MHNHHSLCVISRWALCSCSPWQLTTREMQCVPGSCLGATQCQQRVLRLQPVCFLYLSVSSLLLSEHTMSHCVGLLVLSWNPKDPSWVAVDLGDCPCSDIGLSVGNTNVSMSFGSFMKHSYCSTYKMTLQQCNIIRLGSRNSPQNTHRSVSWNHNLLLGKCNATLRLKKQEGVFTSACPSLTCAVLALCYMPVMSHSLQVLFCTSKYLHTSTYFLNNLQNVLRHRTLHIIQVW